MAGGKKVQKFNIWYTDVIIILMESNWKISHITAKRTVYRYSHNFSASTLAVRCPRFSFSLCRLFFINIIFPCRSILFFGFSLLCLSLCFMRKRIPYCLQNCRYCSGELPSIQVYRKEKRCEFVHMKKVNMKEKNSTIIFSLFVDGWFLYVFNSSLDSFRFKERAFFVPTTYAHRRHI